MNNLLGIITSIIFVIGILAVASILEKKKIIQGEGSRKLIHITLCNWWFVAMIFFDKGIWAAIVPLLFVIINYISYKKQLIPAMERGGGKEDLGTVYYALSLLILGVWTFSIHKPYIGAIGILTMGYGDGLAALIGQKYGKIKYQIHGKIKSIEGSIMVFISTIVITMCIIPLIGQPVKLSMGITLALIATLLEALTPWGLDNLTLPIGTSLIYALMIA